MHFKQKVGFCPSSFIEIVYVSPPPPLPVWQGGTIAAIKNVFTVHIGLFFCARICVAVLLDFSVFSFECSFLTEPVTPQLQSTFQLLQQFTTTFRPQLPDCLLNHILLIRPRSPATSAYRLVQAPQPTPTISRSCRLKSSVCSTVAAGDQWALEDLLPPSSLPTAPLARPLPKTHPAKQCQACLHLDPRVMAPHQAACQLQQVVRDPPALLVSTLTTRVCRKLWTP